MKVVTDTQNKAVDRIHRASEELNAAIMSGADKGVTLVRPPISTDITDTRDLTRGVVRYMVQIMPAAVPQKDGGASKPDARKAYAEGAPA